MRDLLQSWLSRVGIIESSARIYARADGGLVIHGADEVMVLPAPGCAGDPSRAIVYSVGSPGDRGRVPLLRSVCAPDGTRQATTEINWYINGVEARRSLSCLSFAAGARQRGGWGVAMLVALVVFVAAGVAFTPRSVDAVASMATPQPNAVGASPPGLTSYDDAMRAAEAEGARLARDMLQARREQSEAKAPAAITEQPTASLPADANGDADVSAEAPMCLE